MKTKIKALFVIFILILFASTDFAQNMRTTDIRCEGEYTTPIKCGFYTEGYQDGAADAQSNQDNDYKRYKDKFGNRYSDTYQAGYDQGYASVRPFSRWTDKQKDVYDRGWGYGDDDRKREISRLPGRYEGRYDAAYEAYYRQGYRDGYASNSKQYDVPLDNRRGGGRRGTGTTSTRGNRNSTGGMAWAGRVDQRVNIILRGSVIFAQTLSGRNLGQGTSNFRSPLPRRTSQISVRKTDGRGTVRVIQQPNRVNNYTAIVQVEDTRRSSDQYGFELTWDSTTNAFDTYSAGKVRWKGRVDNRASIKISGDTVEAKALSGRAITGASFDIDGYLATRVGRVSVRKFDGRGTVIISQQPSRLNNFTATIEISDPKRSDDLYDIEINW